MQRIVAAVLAPLLITAGCTLSKSSPERSDQSQHSGPVWLEIDSTIIATDALTANTHPFEMSSSDLATLLRGIRVRSARGLLKSLSSREPAFSEEEVRFLAPLMSQALARASRFERVVFRLKYPDSIGADTSGALFVREPYLHFVLGDHRIFNREDPEGAATREHETLFDREEYLAPRNARALPAWSDSDRTHLSINYHRLRADTRLPGNVQEPLVQQTHVQQTTVPMPQKQLQELTDSNLDLREKINTLQQQLDGNRQQLERLSVELDQAKHALIEKDAELKQLQERRNPSKEPKRRAPRVLLPDGQSR